MQRRLHLIPDPLNSAPCFLLQQTVSIASALASYCQCAGQGARQHVFPFCCVITDTKLVEWTQNWLRVKGSL